jgi:hypothetical protein
MERTSRGSKTPTKAVRAQNTAKTPSVKSAKQSQGGDLEKTLALIRRRPGIRPSEINRLLNRKESDGLRAMLIRRGLIRKEKGGSATRYYPV